MSFRLSRPQVTLRIDRVTLRPVLLFDQPERKDQSTRSLKELLRSTYLSATAVKSWDTSSGLGDAAKGARPAAGSSSGITGNARA